LFTDQIGNLKYKHFQTPTSSTVVIADVALPVQGRTESAMAVNGTVPGPLARLREGQGRFSASPIA
jgi:hypothetical protein